MLSNNLINKSLEYYSAHSHRPFVVKPSLPIVYFGDLGEYLSSPLKVITVGKNPSDNEFRLQKDDPYSFCRFNKWNPNKANLIETLNSYFKDIPLSWFSCYEPVLNGMNCSYYPNKLKNRALHTDICSPIATKPTWSKLASENRRALYYSGNELWNQLIEELQPDIMLISVPRNLFSEHFSDGGKELLSFSSKEDGTPRKVKYQVFEHNRRLKSGKIVRVIYGQAAQMPFGTISSAQKQEIGKLCLQ